MTMITRTSSGCAICSTCLIWASQTSCRLRGQTIFSITKKCNSQNFMRTLITSKSLGVFHFSSRIRTLKMTTGYTSTMIFRGNWSMGCSGDRMHCSQKPFYSIFRDIPVTMSSQSPWWRNILDSSSIPKKFVLRSRSFIIKISSPSWSIHFCWRRSSLNISWNSDS